MVELLLVGGMDKTPGGRLAVIVIAPSLSLLVSPEIHIVAHLSKSLRAHLAVLVCHDLIAITVAHEDGCLLIWAVGWYQVLDALLQE